MKKRLLPILLSLILVTAVLLPVSAALLSDGVAVLAEGEALVKSGYLGQTVTFCEADFRQALGVGKIDGITVVSLPDKESGTLKLAATPVAVGQEISAKVLSLLKFVPKDATVSEAAFSFTAGNLAGGAEIPCRIKLLEKQNKAPVTGEKASLAAETKKGISYYGTLCAADPDGDAVRYRVTSYPKHGALSLFDADSGEYRYTPAASFTGRDTFSFVAYDQYGNYSPVATVSVTVSARSSSLVYADMSGERGELASLALTDAGVMLGRLSGDGMWFDPEETVSRGDFTVMAMKCAGITPTAGLTDTCFDDNGDIPASIRGYIATAQSRGYVTGSFDGNGLYFRASDPVSRAEAAVILCRVFGLDTKGGSAVYAPADAVPVWAAASVGVLSEAGALRANADGSLAGKSPLSRADAADMLYTVKNR